MDTQTIAVRRYELDDLETGRVYVATDTLKRTPNGGFIVEATTNGHPPDHDHSVLLGDERAAFDWLGEMPEQIAREVIVGSTAFQNPKR